MNLFKKISLEKLGIFSFLVFFLFTPLFIKVQVADGVYVEPLLPFLAFGVVSIILSLWKKFGSRKFLVEVRNFIFPNSISIFYSFLMLIIFISYFYGLALTGTPSSGDFLRIVKYSLYFLPFPLAIYSGRFLGPKDVKTVLLIFIVVGVTTAAASFIRVFPFLSSGAQIDFWSYSINNRSVGFLGQYLDPFWMSLGSTGRSAGGTYGLYASVVLAVCLAFFARIKGSRNWKFLLSLFAVISLFGSILYTLSRGAVMVGIFVVGGWVIWFLKLRRVKPVSVLLISLLLSSSALIFVNPQVLTKLTSTFSFVVPPTTDSRLENNGRSELVIDSSTMGRVDRWERIFKTFIDYPALAIFGVGYNSRNLAFFTNTEVISSHSLFMDLWVRGGLLALALILVVWFLLFRKVFGFLLSKSGEIKIFGFVLGGFLVGWLIDNLFSGEQFFSDAPMIAFWGVLGLVYSMAESTKRGPGPKKVLIALTSSGPGGAPKVVYDFLSHSKVKDFSFVIAAPAGGEFNKKFMDLGYRVYHAPLDRISIRGFTQLFKISRKENIDLINSHGKGAGFYARKVGFIMGVPVVQTFHGLHYGYRNRLVQFLYISLEKLLANFTTLFINVSAGQQREGLGLKIFSRSKSRLVVNGIDTRAVDRVKIDKTAFRRKLGLGPNDFVVTMAARFDPVKGHERLIEILPDLLKNIPNLKIVFAGGGEERFRIQKLVREKGVYNAVRLLGERPDVLKIFKASDAAILPSYHEGMPLTVLEAMACRLPVVGSDVVGIRDLVKNGETGYLMDFDDRAEVVKALRQLGKSKELRQRMGERGRQFVEEKFPMEKFVKNTLAVYQESLK